MPVDYEKIRDEKRKFDDPEIQYLVRRFVVDSYADQTHFILELLQNAEDAMRKREASWHGIRAASFSLAQDSLRVSHYGKPFNEDDVRSICSVGRSSKQDLTTIGRFGIGFKSVFRFTDSPQVHSGDEDFAIERFVLPKATGALDRHQDETAFLFPLDRTTKVNDYDVIGEGLANLGERTLLFLKEIDELQWEVEGCDYGHYRRDVSKDDGFARRVRVIGHKKDLTGNEVDVHEKWIVFSREVQHEGDAAGHVEIAFTVDSTTKKIHKLAESRLVVYFPTVVETHLGFLVQGPYRTTPNRDNAPEDDEWNRCLVNQTCVLLKDALIWLRDRDLLDVEVLRCLPLTSFPGTRMQPLFDAAKKLLSTEELLPKFGGGYVAADRALMGDSEPLRNLFSEQQLSEIYGRANSWLSGDFTVDRNPELRRYLMSELGFSETTAESIIRLIKPEFLEAQSDGWMIQLYEFLGTQRALRRQLQRLPLIRLDDGTHVAAEVGGQPNAYLPTDDKTDFPTVKKDVCVSADALNFLESLGIKQPDLVDDVIANVMPKYEDADSVIGPEGYESDISRIGNAYRSADSDSQRQRVLDVLTSTYWVMTTDSGHGTKRRSKPGDVYLATRRLTTLFSMISGVRFVDQKYKCLSNDTVQDLLIRCGVASNFRPIKFENNDRFNSAQLEDMRARSHNNTGVSSQHPPQDWRLHGLELILQSVDSLNIDERKQISSLLWESLSELDTQYFEGEYRWSYYSHRSCKFKSSFVNLLNESAWIAQEDGGLKRPSEVEFGELGWPSNEFLQSKIEFKTSEIENVAKKYSLDPGLLDQIVNRFASGELTEHDWNKAFPAKTVAYIQNENGTPIESAASGGTGAGSYAQSLEDAMTPSPTGAPDSPVVMPTGGPITSASARQDTQKALRQGRLGRRVTREVSRFEPSATALSLDEKFKNMLLGDYGRRCQICGSTFRTRKGDLQVFADHVVAPSEGSGTNHFGNLMSLCGWHYALISYGQWVLLDPLTEEPIKATEADQDVGYIIDLLDKAETEWDNDGNEFVTLPVRFWNIYPDWRSDPDHVDQEIRFSLPHRTYLVELLKT